jgi:hypothetical protein
MHCSSVWGFCRLETQSWPKSDVLPKTVSVIDSSFTCTSVHVFFILIYYLKNNWLVFLKWKKLLEWGLLFVYVSLNTASCSPQGVCCIAAQKHVPPARMPRQIWFWLAVALTPKCKPDLPPFVLQPCKAFSVPQKVRPPKNKYIYY